MCVAISLQRRAVAAIACPFIDSEARTRLEFVTDDSPPSPITAEEQHLQMTCFAVNNLFFLSVASERYGTCVPMASGYI